LSLASAVDRVGFGGGREHSRAGRTGERNPDRLCDSALNVLRMPPPGTMTHLERRGAFTLVCIAVGFAVVARFGVLSRDRCCRALKN
jgi:hypothetical protein